MKTKNVVVVGCNTERGKHFCSSTTLCHDVTVVAGVDNEDLGIHPFPVFSTVEDLSVHHHYNDIEIDIIIDFSEEKFTIPALIFAVRTLTPLVIGFYIKDINTTLKLLEYWSRIIPIAEVCWFGPLEGGQFTAIELLLNLRANPDKMQPGIYTITP